MYLIFFIPEKGTKLANFQARVAMGKKLGGYIGKPWIVIRFIRKNDF